MTTRATQIQTAINNFNSIFMVDGKHDKTCYKSLYSYVRMHYVNDATDDEIMNELKPYLEKHNGKVSESTNIYERTIYYESLHGYLYLQSFTFHSVDGDSFNIYKIGLSSKYSKDRLGNYNLSSGELLRIFKHMRDLKNDPYELTDFEIDYVDQKLLMLWNSNDVKNDEKALLNYMYQGFDHVILEEWFYIDDEFSENDNEVIEYFKAYDERDDESVNYIIINEDNRLIRKPIPIPAGKKRIRLNYIIDPLQFIEIVKTL